MDKCLIQAVTTVRAHEALRVSERVESPLAKHVKVIAMRDDLIDVVR